MSKSYEDGLEEGYKKGHEEGYKEGEVSMSDYIDAELEIFIDEIVGAVKLLNYDRLQEVLNRQLSTMKTNKIILKEHLK